MSRLLILLSHSLHVRNFLASGCLKAMADRGHEVTLLLPDGLMTEAGRHFDLSRWCGRVLAMEPYLGGSARTRLRASLRTASLVRRRGFKTYGHKILLNRALGFRLQVAFYQALERRLRRGWTLEELARRIEALIPPRQSAVALLDELRPDLFFCPTLVHEGADVELLKAARLRGVPTAAYVAGWDTLTSKGFFLLPPDYLLVWGEQSVRHAVEHHGFARERVIATGAPHLDVYGPGFPVEPREEFLGRRGIDPAKRVILFAGTTISYWEDEPLQLRSLSEAVASGELKDCVVWYRPHPRRAYRDVEPLRDLPGVYVDDQVIRQKTTGAASYSTRPEDLLHYRSLMDASEGLITAFSTMIIEAALLGKPSLVVGFGRSDGSHARLIEHSKYEHSDEVVNKTPGVTLCRSLDELKQGVQRIFAGELAPLAGVLRKRAGQIANNLDGRGTERIVATLERLAASRGTGQ
ncbi:MAG: CDP-glycerol glycerophosphotransferase family protein [Candidatus Rokuibacteriota bacterium]